MTVEQAISWLSTKPKAMPVFVLLGTDPLAPDAIAHWRFRAYMAGVCPEKIEQAVRVEWDCEAWPEKSLPG